MLPELHWTIGRCHLVVSLYAVAIAAGVGAGLAVAVWRSRAREAMLVVAPLAVLAGVVAAEAWHRACHGSPGLSSMGGIAGGLVAIALASRALGSPVLETLDALAPGALLGFAIGRVGCFLASCCHGRATALPWGVVFPVLGPPARHPAQLYEAVADLCVAWWCCRPRGPAGHAAGRGMIGYGAVRVLLEAVRDPGAIDVVVPHGPSLAQWSALVLVAAGLRLASRATP